MTIYPDSPEGIILKELPELLASDSVHDNVGALACADYLEACYGESPHLETLRKNAEKITRYNVRGEIVEKDGAMLGLRALYGCRNAFSAHRGLERPRVVGMFSTAAYAATTKGLQDPQYISLLLGNAHKSARGNDSRKYLSNKLNVPFCESRLKNKADPKVESAFAMEPFVALQEDLNQILPEWSRQSFRADHQKLVKHCHDLLEREHYKPRTV